MAIKNITEKKRNNNILKKKGILTRETINGHTIEDWKETYTLEVGLKIF